MFWFNINLLIIRVHGEWRKFESWSSWFTSILQSLLIKLMLYKHSSERWRWSVFFYQNQVRCGIHNCFARFVLLILSWKRASHIKTWTLLQRFNISLKPFWGLVALALLYLFFIQSTRATLKRRIVLIKNEAKYNKSATLSELSETAATKYQRNKLAKLQTEERAAICSCIYWTLNISRSPPAPGSSTLEHYQHAAG